MNEGKTLEGISYNVIVVGGGPAGVVAALRARELGASVALVERRKIGGVCTNDGCVPTRVLARAARLRREADQFATYGLDAPAPSLDFARLMSRTQQVVYQIHEKKQLLNHLSISGIQVFDQVGDARFIDDHTLMLGNGQRLYGEKLILCAGGRARRLPFAGADLALTHSDIWTLRRLPESLIIVGAAATGCQLASIFNAFGTEVTLVEVAPRILAVEDADLSAAIGQAFTTRGIRILTGINGIDRLEKLNGQTQLTYRQSAGSHLLQAEAVILAVGWIGNVDTLDVTVAGVESERGYIKVNDTLQTSVPHIYAAGDITGRMMLVQSASHDGRVAAENAVLGSNLNYRHQIVPHGGFTEPEYGSVGLTETAAREQLGEGGFVTTTIQYEEMDRAVIDGHPTGFCKLIVSTETHHILGAAVVGEQALEVVEIIAAGMASGMVIEQLAELEIAYPTYCGVSGLAARRIVQQLGATKLVPEWRGLDRRGLEPHQVEWERRDV